MSISAKLLKEFRPYLEKWNFSDEDIEFLQGKLENFFDETYDEEDLEDFLVGNLKDSDPRRFDEDGLESHILIDNYHVIIQFTQEGDFDLSLWKLEHVISVGFRATDQRRTVEAFIDTGSPASITTYEKSQFKDYERFANNLKVLIDRR